MNTIYVLVLLPAILYACISLVRYYIKTFREISRLKLITSSPIINHMSETLTGVSTIKAFQRENSFLQLNYEFLDCYASTHFWQTSMNSWVGLRAEMISMTILIFTSMLCVSFPLIYKFIDHL